MSETLDEIKARHIKEIIEFQNQCDHQQYHYIMLYTAGAGIVPEGKEAVCSRCEKRWRVSLT